MLAEGEALKAFLLPLSFPSSHLVAVMSLIFVTVMRFKEKCVTSQCNVHAEVFPICEEYTVHTAFTWEQLFANGTEVNGLYKKLGIPVE